MANHWKRVDGIVMLWIMNVVAKNLLDGIIYATSAQVIYNDFYESLNKIDSSRIFNLH